MRAVIVGDKTYFTLFHLVFHNPPIEIDAKYSYSHGKRKGLAKKLLVSHTTRCGIKVGNTADNPTSLTADYLSHADSFCAVTDDFDLHKGRRESLKRALKNAGLEDESKLFWDEFIKTLPKPKPSMKQMKQKLQYVNDRLTTLTKAIDTYAQSVNENPGVV